MSDETQVPEQDDYPDFEATMQGLFGDGHDSDEELPEAPPDEEEQPEPEQAEPDDVPDGAEEQAKEQPAEKPKGVQSDVERATHNLRFKAKVPQSVLDGMTPEQITAWWSELAPVTSENDRAFSERAELRRRLEEIEAAKQPESAEAVPAGGEDFEVPQALVDELGAEAANGLKQLVSAALGRSQKVISSLESRVQAQEARAERAEAEVLYRELVEAGELGGSPPEFSKVLQRAYDLAPAKGEWSEASGRDRGRALLLAAARLEGAGAVQADKARTATANARRNGTATPASQRSAPKRKLSEDEIIDAKIAAIQRGVTDPHKLREMYGG